MRRGRKGDMRLVLSRSMQWIASLPIYWLLASGALWWFYDIGPLIQGGYFSRGQAALRVIEMGLIVTILTITAWIWAVRIGGKKTLLGVWWSAAWRTFLILLFYLLAVLVRREMWTQSQGINDDAMFLPLIGHINAVFFSELRWLSFLIEIIPCMGVLSGVLFCAQERLRPWVDLRREGIMLCRAPQCVHPRCVFRFPLHRQ